MNAKERSEGFRALVENHRNSGHYFEEVDGRWRLWRDLSPQGKLEYLAADAALYDVPFKRFHDSVREVIGDAALAEAALRTVLSDALEFRSLARLLPDDGRTESTPLSERFKEILSRAAEPGREPQHHQGRGVER
ncbi:MAG TPA: hypothetical protein VG826_33000 [Pirellulales bacterium]|nr:hypothetical protein [Pirellulales bacterium]